MQTIHYKEKENSISVGFKKHNFVVFGEIGITEEYTKEQYIQKLYEQCKSSLDYETERYLEGKSNSIVTEEIGDEFIPEEPKLKTLKLLVYKDYVQFEEERDKVDIYLSTITKDQYGEDIEVEINIISTVGVIEDNVLTISTIEEFAEITVTAVVEDIIDSKIIKVYPYEEPMPDKIDILGNRIADVEQTIDIMLGGEIIE